MELKKVLMLTSNYGDGHIKTANNLLKAIHKIKPDAEVKIINLFEQSHPLINKLIQYTYLYCCINFPLIYDYFYYSTRHPSKNYLLNVINGILGTNKLKEFLDQFKPDIVINTYPYQAMPKLYKKGITDVPTYAVITDYGSHSQWTGFGISKYYVAHEMVKKEMAGWRIEEDKIEVLGMPINIEYDEKIDTNKFCEKYSIENKELPIITIITGAYGGMKKVDQLCRKLHSLDLNLQFVVVCGKNNSLKEKLAKTLHAYADKIKILGFVENLHEIIKASSLIITKAGGLTVSEILKIGTPMIIFGHPSGQEYENAKFLLKNKCSYHAKNIKQLTKIIEHLSEEFSTLKEMRENAKRVSDYPGCEGITNSIINHYENAFEHQKVDNINEIIGKPATVE